MHDISLNIETLESTVILNFLGELSLYTITKLQKQVDLINLAGIKKVEINLTKTTFLDTAAAIFIHNMQHKYIAKNVDVVLLIENKETKATLDLVKKQTTLLGTCSIQDENKFLYSLGKLSYNYYIGIISFFEFLGNLFAAELHYLKSPKNIRYKEIAFEINESGIKALPIIALTSFLIGLVLAYQSAVQLKIYGANIFLVDMIGISILRELAPLITAIIIAGRSGSSFTAQIGAMKITEELDAMRTMGFDPYIFLVMPRIIALMLVMPILIFVSDIMGILGGAVVANIDLQITPTLFMERFLSVVDIKHFYIGIIKGPFFAFLIASIAIYRGLRVKDDTQSIGFNTTKSVVEAIFAVIVCDALFSIIFTNLGV